MFEKGLAPLPLPPVSQVGGGGVEENGEEQVAGNNPDESDPAEEAELDIEVK